VVPNELKDESKATLLEKDNEPLREKSSKKNRKKEKENVEKVSDKKEHKKRSLLLPLEASAVGILLLIVLGSFYVIHCVWAAAEVYSAPSIVLSSHTPEGVHVFDDVREAYVLCMVKPQY
jgi:dolichyl-diphosphooligosaccharide--protein glycosyltransferase